MLRRVLVAAMVVVIAAVGAMAQAGRRSNPMEVHPCRLRLRVVSELDQRGLRDLTVEVMDATGTPSALNAKQTDSSGNADFSSFTGGHQIRISGPGIEEYTGYLEIAGSETSHSERIEVRVKPGEATESLATKGTVSALRLKVPGKAQKQLERGSELMADGQYAEAKQHFEAAIALYAEYDLAYNSLGVAEMDMQNVNAARTAFTKAVELNPDFAGAQRNLARILLADNKFEEAATALQRSLETEPDDVWALDKAAYAELRAQKYALAVAHARKVHQLPHASYAESHYIAGLALEALGQQKEALAEYQLYLQESPRGANARLAQLASDRLSIAVR